MILSVEKHGYRDGAGFSMHLLNKSENATPELFAIYIQNYANQECNLKCSLMFKYWVLHNSKSFTDVVTRKHMKVIKMGQGSIF